MLIESSVIVTATDQGSSKIQGCAYCRSKVGTPHAPECTMRERVVIARISIEIPVVVPATWSGEMINAFYGNNTWSTQHAITLMIEPYERAKVGGPQAHSNARASFLYIRDADESDVRFINMEMLRPR